MRYLFGLAVMLASASGAQAPARFDARAYLDTAIATVRAHALSADRVDWPALSARVHAEGDGVGDAFDTYPALVTLLRGLGDRHSFLQLSEERAEAYRAAKGQDFRYPADPPARAGPPVDRRFYGRNVGAVDRMIGGARVRTVVAPAIMADAATRTAYARDLDRAVSAGARPCGWVVDLRGNSGGNMWPMLAGLSKLLGDGRVGGSAGRDPAEAEGWLVRGGTVSLVSANAGITPAQAVPGWTATPGAARAPVAVLTDRGTASSGEIVAVAFAGRANTRRIGGATAGVSTATQGFALPDGANLVIVTAVTADRTGRAYPAGLSPDEAVAPDMAQDTAERWVASACAPGDGARRRR